MNRNLMILLALLMGSYISLFSSPLGAPQQFNAEAQQTEKLKDGQSIVLGKFMSRQEADAQLNSLLDFMDGNSELVKLELAHGFDYALKEEKGLFVVSIEPFVSEDVLTAVLDTIKTRYPEAQAEICVECVREEFLKSNTQQDAEQEIMENEIAIENSSEHIEITVEEDVVVEDIDVDEVSENGETIKDEPISAELPFKTEYIFYGVGALALLLLILLVIRRPKSASDKELKEMHKQAQQLEKEMAGQSDDSEEAVKEEDASITNTPVAPDKAAAKEKIAPVQESAAIPEPVAKVAPEPNAPVKRKLREANKDVANVTKENFKEFKGLRLLIAEDNLINQKVIVGLLKDSGINIKIANDGQECLDILAEDSNYPIILMDAHMPRVDGLEATRIIRQNPAYDHITVMALSGDTGADDIKKMREAGMEEQLEKPLRIAALYQALYCYFDPNASTSSEETMTIHLDSTLGLDLLGGDVELYQEILNEFQELYHDSDEKIELWIKDGDLDKAKALLLDVRGIGETVGTAELTETAERFREAIIAGDSEKYPDLLKLYHMQLKAVLADMAEV